MLILLALLSLLPGNNRQPAEPGKASLKIEVHNVRLQKGAVYVALFRPGKDFPEGKPIEGKKIDVSGNQVQTTFLVEPGDYAVAVYHDENGNGKLDKRMFGIPKEPYGFSNNFRPVMSAPKFGDCRVSIGDAGKAISIKLI